MPKLEEKPITSGYLIHAAGIKGNHPCSRMISRIIQIVIYMIARL
jgi:hypothetical protein